MNSFHWPDAVWRWKAQSWLFCSWYYKDHNFNLLQEVLKKKESYTTMCCTQVSLCKAYCTYCHCKSLHTVNAFFKWFFICGKMTNFCRWTEEVSSAVIFLNSKRLEIRGKCADTFWRRTDSFWQHIVFIFQSDSFYNLHHLSCKRTLTAPYYSESCSRWDL